MGCDTGRSHRNTIMHIVIGADHRGFDHKEYIKHHTMNIDIAVTWIDVGAYDLSRSDYPLFAQKACAQIIQGNAAGGVLICGSGVGMAVAANRFRGIYAALAWNRVVARQSKEHDNANIVVIPSDYVSKEEATQMVTAWLSATFAGGRYQERIAMIDSD